MPRALENRTQTAYYPSTITTGPHANSSQPALLTAVSENIGGDSLETNGNCTRLQTVFKGVTNGWNFCMRLTTLSAPTPDARWAPWVECMREPARTFFSLHRTSKRDDAQTRLSALHKQLAVNRWESVGRHTGTGETTVNNTCMHGRLMTLKNLQMRRWTRPSAAARRTALESELHRPLKDGRSHGVRRLTQLLGGKGVGVR